jgi:hypothetical protein
VAAGAMSSSLTGVVAIRSVRLVRTDSVEAVYGDYTGEED